MFTLHPRLAEDTHEVVRWPLCRVRLMLDATYPWLILVPQRTGLVQMHELAAADQGLLMAEIARAAGALESLYLPDRINVGALGNVVDQFHVHVVARYRSDPAWPGPVWGAGPPKPYAAADLEATLERLRGILGGA